SRVMGSPLWGERGLKIPRVGHTPRVAWLHEKRTAVVPLGGCQCGTMAVMTDYHLSVREWPESERPREKLAQSGAAALSTAELLAIILRTGTAREDVVALAQRLLVQKGGLLGLAHASMTELAAEHGLGLAKSAQLQAALELGKRLLHDPRAARAQVRSPKDVADLVMWEMGLLQQE